jgi:CRP/FNR family cyclic AMP-dependent transcriptional regulator
VTENRLRLLQNIPLFGGIREDILHLLLDNAREATIPEGEFLFLENAPGDAMYVLESGQVAILKQWQGIYYQYLRQMTRSHAALSS